MSQATIRPHLLTATFLLLGGLLGVVISSVFPARSSIGADSSEEETAVSPPSDLLPVADAHDPVGSLAESSTPSRASTPSLKEIFQAAGRVSALRAALAELDPPTSLWPEEVPEAMRPDVFEEHLEAALGIVGAGEVEAMNCDEYPCVATLVLPVEEADIGGAEGLGTLMNVREELSVLLGMAVDAHMNTHPSGIRLTLSAHPEAVEDARLRQRLEEAWLLASQ